MKLRPRTLRAKLVLVLLPGLIGLLGLLSIGRKALDTIAIANHNLAETGYELGVTHTLELKMQEVLIRFTEQFMPHKFGTGNVSFSKPVQEIEDIFIQARELCDEPEELLLLEQAEMNWKQTLGLFELFLSESAARTNSSEVNVAVIQAHVYTQMALGHIDKLREFVLQEMETTEANSLAIQQSASRLLIIGALIGVVIELTMGVVLSSYLTQPLRLLQTGITRFGDGDLNFRLKVPLHDETGALATKFNLMAERLQAAIRDRSHYADRLRQTLNRHLSVREVERERIAQDIHDGLSQWLLGALFELQAARQLVNTNPATAERHMVDAQQVIRGAKDEMNRIIYDLYPHLLESSGWLDAIYNYTEQLRSHHLLECHVTVAGDEQELTKTQKRAIYRIVQEALNNIVQHAEVTEAQIKFAYEPTHLSLEIADDGRGFDTRDAIKPSNTLPTKHLGLQSMKQRALSVGIDFSIISTIGKGTRIRINVPYEKKQDQDTSIRDLN